MVEAPRRPTLQEIQAQRKSSITEIRLNKRLGMSLPNLGLDQMINCQRNSLLSGIISSDSGETREEVKAPEAQTVKIKTEYLEKINPLCFSPLPAVAATSSSLSNHSLSLCLLVLRTSPKLVNVFELPDFPASLSIHTVQSYYSELIQQLGKAIFSVQNENPTLLARYSS